MSTAIRIPNRMQSLDKALTTRPQNLITHRAPFHQKRTKQSKHTHKFTMVCNIISTHSHTTVENESLVSELLRSQTAVPEVSLPVGPDASEQKQQQYTQGRKQSRDFLVNIIDSVLDLIEDDDTLSSVSPMTSNGANTLDWASR